MKFKPVNRYLLVEPIEIKPEPKGKPKVLVPDIYKPETARFKMCRVVRIGPECTKNVRANSLAVVENTMVEKIDVLDNTFYVILETHVIGIIDEQ